VVYLLRNNVHRGKVVEKLEIGQQGDNNAGCGMMAIV